MRIYYWKDFFGVLRDFSIFLLFLGLTLLFLIGIGETLIDQLTFVQRAPTAIVKGVVTKTDSVACYDTVKFPATKRRSIEILYEPSSWSLSIGPVSYSECGNVGDTVDC